MTWDTSDPFALFDLPASFELDLQQLEQAFLRQSAACHPDRFDDPLDQADAAERAATINEAYRSLKDPIQRAYALLKRQGIDDPAAQQPQPDPDWLMDIMEVRQQIDEAVQNDDASQKNALSQQVRDQQQQLLAELAQSFREQAPAERVLSLIAAMRYQQRMAEALGQG